MSTVFKKFPDILVSFEILHENIFIVLLFLRLLFISPVVIVIILLLIRMEWKLSIFGLLYLIMYTQMPCCKCAHGA